VLIVLYLPVPNPSVGICASVNTTETSDGWITIWQTMRLSSWYLVGLLCVFEFLCKSCLLCFVCC
jgi:hypothetical protein